MATKPVMAGLRSLVALFEAGSLGSQSDRDLLECFQSDSGSAGQEAFRILVERHGPMVLGLCRSLVRDQHEAEDAFQATFLVLVRKARSIERRDTLGPWLHGVAARVARRARSRLIRRHQREVPVIGEIPARAQSFSDGFSTEQLLHEEIARLPESFRRPVILCCLQGLSYDLAAQRLGVKEPTLRGRLERARKRLATRLRARGVPAVLAGPALESIRSSMSPLPSTLIESTVQFSMRWSSVTGLLGGGAVIPGSISALAQGVIQSMLFQTVRVAAVAVLTAGAVGTVVLAQQGKDRPIAIATSAASAVAAVPPEHTDQDRDERVEKEVRARELKNSLRLAEKSAQIRKKLDMIIDADFPEGRTTLDKFLKHIKQSTTDTSFSGIPIYVDPAGLAEVKKTISTEVTFLEKKQTVRSFLDSTLRQIGLSYRVHDGFLMVSSHVAIVESRVEEIDRKLDRVLEMLSRLDRAK